MADRDDKKKPARARANSVLSQPAPSRARAESKPSDGAPKPKVRARRSTNPSRSTPTPELEPTSVPPDERAGLDDAVDEAVLVDRSAAEFAIPKPPLVPTTIDESHVDDEDFEDDEDDEDDDFDELGHLSLAPRGSAPPPAVPGGRTSASQFPPAMVSPSPDDETGAVLITGICGRLGKLLARELHRDMRVIGIDRRPFPDAPKDVVLHRFDVRRKKTRDVFRSGRVRAVVHLGVMHDPRSTHRDRHSWNVVAFQKLLEYMAQYGVRKLIVLSSANVYGPQPDNPQFLTEEAPLLGSQEFYAIRDLVELDMLAQGTFWKNPEIETVILRPCHILGEVRNAPSNYLRLPHPMTILGFDPMVQGIHERDVVRAIRMALEPGVRGVFNIRGPGELPLSKVLEMAGRTPRAIAAPFARAALQQLFRLRLASFPAPEIDHIRYVCMVDDTRAREVLGWSPKYTLEQAIDATIMAA